MHPFKFWNYFFIFIHSETFLSAETLQRHISILHCDDKDFITDNHILDFVMSYETYLIILKYQFQHECIPSTSL